MKMVIVILLYRSLEVIRSAPISQRDANDRRARWSQLYSDEWSIKEEDAL